MGLLFKFITLIDWKERAMKSNVGRWALVVFLTIFTMGCSSIRARTDLRRDNEWTIYPGVREDVKEMGRLVRGEPPRSDEAGPESGWLMGMTGVILVFDFPFSAVLDTVASPYDLYRIFNPQDFGDRANPGS